MKTKLALAISSVLVLSACNDSVVQSSGNFLGAVSIEGDAIVGETVSSVITDGNGVDPSNVTYTWMVDDTVVEGASSGTYLVTGADEGSVISLSVSYIDNDGYNETVISPETDTVEIPSVPSAGSVVITGDVFVGFELTAEIIDENGVGDSPVEYTWMADGVVIADASSAKYMLTADELGKTITVAVKYVDNDDYPEETLSYPTVAVIEKPADVITSLVASITDNMTDDAGELRYKHSSAIEAGKLTVSFAKEEVLTPEGNAKEAYIALYGSSTSTSKALVDLRIGNGSFTIRDQSGIDVDTTFTPGDWIDVEMTWDASSASASVAPLVTISINGASVTVDAFESVSSELESVMDGVQTLVFKLSDTSSVVTGAYLVDNIKLYADIAGTSIAFEDDFEGFSVADSLDTDNADSPYNSSTAEAVVAEVIREGVEEPVEPEVPAVTRGQYASITDTMTDDAGELRFKDSLLETGKLTASFNKAEGDSKDAYIGLYGSSTSTSNAVIDLRIQNGGFVVRNNADAILSAVTFTTGDWHDVEITWDATSTTQVATLTLTIDDVTYGPFLSATTEGGDLTSDGVSTVIFKLGDNGGVASTAFLVDDFNLYSDIAGTTEVFTDDFEGYAVGDSLDTDNAASPYNSSSAEVVVAVSP